VTAVEGTAADPLVVTFWTEWYCPNCKQTGRTSNQGPHVRYHTCPKLRMLSAPMLRAGTKAKVTAREREDYEGADAGHVFHDMNGRPVMSIVTERDEGQDCVVFAATAMGGTR
jgi:hypothetical protein